MKKEEKEEQIVKHRKIKFANILVVLLLFYIIGYFIYRILVAPINNIYIVNNKYLSDQEIIDISGIRNYPSFILTTSFSIKNKLMKNSLINDVKVTKKIGNVIEINVEEYEPLFVYDNKILLSSGNTVDGDYNLPVIKNKINDDILDKLISKYQNVENEIRLLISEIEYVPNDIDKERFLITMNDGKYVYITLYKINSLNEYVKIVSSLNTNKNGILYLDSGNYFEVFD